MTATAALITAGTKVFYWGGRRVDTADVLRLVGDDQAVIVFTGAISEYTVPVAELELYRVIQRVWHMGRRGGASVRVETRHPQLGVLDRGILARMPDGGWQITNYDGMPLGTHVGDYRDAERILLDATSVMDEPVPAEELTEWEAGL